MGNPEQVKQLANYAQKQLGSVDMWWVAALVVDMWWGAALVAALVVTVTHAGVLES